MAFKVLFISHVPDADFQKHRTLETPKYKLYVNFVKNQSEALEICKNLVKNEGIKSILLCPGFTHKDIAEISEVAGKDVGVSVARGDGPSNKIAMEVMKREGWF